MFDVFLFPLENFSVGHRETITANDFKLIEDFKKEYTKETHLIVNIIFTDEKLNEFINFLESIDIFKIFDKIIVADVGLMYYFYLQKKSNKVIYNPNTLIYNKEDFNILKENKLYGAYISSTIDIKDKLEIIKNKKLNAFLIGYGYFPVLYTKRLLITNYSKEFNIKLDSDDFYLIEQKRPNEHIPIRENKLGTILYSDFILNLKDYINDLKEAGLDYYIFNQEHLLLDDLIKEYRELL